MPEHVIEVLVVNGLIEKRLQRAQLMIIAHEADGIEALRLEHHLDVVIVPMQTRARMPLVQAANHMRSGKGKPFADRVHLPTQISAEMKRDEAHMRATLTWTVSSQLGSLF
jgi:hypothetical protein